MGVEQRQLDSALRAIRVKAWRLHLETPGVVATVPMLRGVWGAALRAESEACYCRLFEGAESERPRYLMRPAPQVAQPARRRVPAVSRDDKPARRPGRRGDRLDCLGPGLPAGAGASSPSLPHQFRRAFGVGWLGARAGAEAAGFCAGRPALAGRNRGNAVPARIPRPAQAAAPGQAHRVTDSGRHRPGGPAPGLRLAGPDTDPLWAARRYWLELGRAVPFEPWQGRRLDLVRTRGRRRPRSSCAVSPARSPFPSVPAPFRPSWPPRRGSTSARGP